MTRNSQKQSSRYTDETGAQLLKRYHVPSKCVTLFKRHQQDYPVGKSQTHISRLQPMEKISIKGKTVLRANSPHS